MCNEFPPHGYEYKNGHWYMPQMKLMVDLLGCPKGRIFMKAMDGEWFVRRTDEEVKQKKIKHYRFSNQHIIDNPKHFKKVKPAKL